MPVPTNTSRPSLPYNAVQSLPNNQRYGLLQQRPPTAAMLDAEFNALIDAVNMLAEAVNQVQAGVITGSDDPNNANKLPKTDGAGNLSFTYVTSAEIEANAIIEPKLAPQSVTTPKIADGAVTSAKLADSCVTTAKLADNVITTAKIANNAVATVKIADLAVTTPKLADNAVTTAKIANSSVTTEKLPDNCVATAKIAENAVTAAKLNSAGAATGTVATSGAGSTVNWSAIPTAGKVLQIVNYVTSDKIKSLKITELLYQFEPNFALTITPKSRTSFIGLFITLQAAPLTVPGWVSARLYRNEVPYIPGVNNNYGAIFSKYIEQVSKTQIGTTCFSGFFHDSTARSNLSPICYEIVTTGAVILNGDQNEIGASSFTTISSIYAIEIQL